MCSSDLERATGSVNVGDNTHVSVEHTFPSGAVVLCPGQVVVVADLRHFVAQPEQGAVDLYLLFLSGRRIDRFPQQLVTP